MSDTTFRLQIMASDHMVYDGDAESVSLETTEGSVGILASHSNVIMAVVPGIVEFLPADNSASATDPIAMSSAGSDGKSAINQDPGSTTHTSERRSQSGMNQLHGNTIGRQQIVVSDGLLKVENGEVMILVDTAERPEDIDEARARRAEEKAREELKRANSQRDHALVEAELSRALSRIQASKSRHTL